MIRVLALTIPLALTGCLADGVLPTVNASADNLARANFERACSDLDQALAAAEVRVRSVEDFERDINEVFSLQNHKTRALSLCAPGSDPTNAIEARQIKLMVDQIDGVSDPEGGENGARS